ncbi:MAG: hypothetical protein OXC46_03135 [Thaumarchaeota archaeon]|nr:hypothetical protein [Nitrososphaerota archaeon]
MFIFDSLTPRFGIPQAGSEDERLDTIEATLSALATGVSKQNSNVIRILKRVKNRHVVNVSTGKEIFYDDDQQTAIQENNLLNENGQRIQHTDDIADSTPDRILD